MDKISVTDNANQSTCTAESDGPGLSSAASGVMPSYPSRSSDDLRPLLKVSSPIPVGAEVGRYRVRIWRKSKRQPFGIQFSSSNNMIEIAEDLTHLGLRQFDQVISVNGMKVRTVEECMGVLRDATTLDLVLQHTELDGEITTVGPATGSGWCGSRACVSRQPTSAPMSLRTLLASSQLQMLSEDGKDFQLILERKSLKQRFGVNFSAERIKGGLVINIAEDQPHLGLKAGDELVSVNGIAMQNSVECQRTLEKSMIVTLKLKRKVGDVGVCQEIEDDTICEEVLERDSRPCSAVCG